MGGGSDLWAGGSDLCEGSDLWVEGVICGLGTSTGGFFYFFLIFFLLFSH